MHDRLRLAIAIGNTRLRVAIFQDLSLVYSEACNYSEMLQLKERLGLEIAKLDPKLDVEFEAIAIASVVPNVITPWHGLPQTQLLTTSHVPIGNIYATMGIDRALALWGAVVMYGLPILVIDAGTALTFSGVDADCNFVGGAILAGLRTQAQSLPTATAALPIVDLPDKLPPRWATDTMTAMQSGLAYGAIATVRDFVSEWRSQFPCSQIIVTGGDGERLCQWGNLDTMLNLRFDPNLIFGGIRELWKSAVSIQK
jgi:type III pantothenate kinase